MSRARPLEIAIVGMGCRFPGAADLAAYWDNILAGRDAIVDTPRDRWDAATFVDPKSTANDRLPCGRGGYLDTPIHFDAAAHGIMPRTVEGGEPEQFLVLDATAAALADAGLTPGAIEGRRVQVVIGRGNYFNRGNLTRLQHGRLTEQTLAILASLHPGWSEADRQAVRAELKKSLPPFEAATIAGQLTNATAGRVAHRFDLGGTAYVVDAASASSLVALDLAAQALVSRQADLALAAGVYIEADVDFPLVFRQLGAMSPTGSSRPFSADADGMLSGEGVGVVLLKRRADAERDGDRIYAVLQAVGTAVDGRSRGLAAPSARGHARAIRRAYRRSGIDPSTVMLVEGHGLGVPAADRAELRALHAVFPPPPRGRRTLGAVSSMIGHAMPAAGMAGLIKAALSLYQRALPPTLHAGRPHPLIDRPHGAFALSGETRPWIHADLATPRRAGVNAFGFAGINAHAVLEEHAASADAPAESGHPGALLRWETEAILLSAPDRQGLADRVRTLIGWLGQHRGATLKDIAYTLGCANDHEAARIGLVASSPEDLAGRLAALLPKLEDSSSRAVGDGRGIYHWENPVGASGGLAFLFPGEGSQYPGMLADLCLHFPEVRRQFDTADRIALDQGDAPPSESLFGASASAEGSAGLWSAPTAVNLILNAQWALYQVLTRLGLRPDAVAGHSSGEILALAAAGVLEADRQLERQLGRLGAIFRGLETSGEMPAARLIAVAADRGRVEAACRAVDAVGVAVAIDNCPHQVVLAGPPAEVERVAARLRAENVPLEVLPFDRAYHTPEFAAVIGPIADSFAGLTFRQPDRPVYSCATARRMPADVAAIRELAIAQWTSTVAFRETVEAMHADGLRVFVDVGARGNLAAFVQDTLRGRPAFAIATNLPRRSGLTQLNHLVAALFAQGLAIRPEFLYARRRPRRIDWGASEPPARALVEIKLGFPEMTLSPALTDRLASPNRRADSSTQPAPFVASEWRSASETPGPRPVPEPSPPDLLIPTALALESRLPAAFDRQDRFPAGFAHPRWTGPSSWPADEPESDSPGQVVPDGAMLAFQETMRAFLETQHAVIGAYLGSSGEEGAVAGDDSLAPFDGFAASTARDLDHPSTVTGAEPGPWVGEVRRLVPGVEVETVYRLDGRVDPIADHHTLGGRRVSALDPSRRGLAVLPFAVMAEMTAQAAALVASPGLVLTRLERVHANRWVQYEDAPVVLELRGRREPAGEAWEERVYVGLYNRGTDGRAAAPRPVFEAIAVFAAATPAPPPASPWGLADPRPCRFTAGSLYGEQWLFHGPAFQSLVEVGPIDGGGISGVLRVLPWEPLLAPGLTARMHTDFIIIDTFTHLLGCWGLDHLADRGDVVFPLSMAALEVFGDRPALGTDVACRITITDLQHHRVRVEADIVRPDGTVWIRIRSWEDWRFHWPGRYRDVFRQPRDTFVGEELPIDDPAAASVVWMAPPADMGRPVWRDVLEAIQLGPEEREAHLALGGSESTRSHRLWGLVAAREAARRTWQSEGRPPVYPADLAIIKGERGRPILIRLDDPSDRSLPAIAIAEAEGVAVAIAARDPLARPGIAVERIAEGADSEWAARRRSARQAAARSFGLDADRADGEIEIVAIDDASGSMLLRAGRAHPQDLHVATARRGEYAWAWTLAGASQHE